MTSSVRIFTAEPAKPAHMRGATRSPKVRTPLIDLPITVDTVKVHVRAILDLPEYAHLTPNQRQNRKRELTYRLLGASCAKRRGLKHRAIERQQGRCVGCGDYFCEDVPPQLQFKLSLSRGGKARDDNAHVLCVPCAAISNPSIQIGGHHVPAIAEP